MLEQGSTILAAESPKPGEQTGYNGGAYDAAEPNTAWDAYQDYGHNHWHNSLLWGEDLHDLSITGPGLIYGKGLSFGANRAARGNYPIYVAEQAGVGNKAIALKNCRNVLLRDFSILKGGHFGLLLTGVDNLTIDNLKIDTDRDGMDIDCCQNVRVSNCTVNSPWDDGICPKSSLRTGLCAPHAQPDHHQLLGHRLLRTRLGARRDVQEICARRSRAAHWPHQVRHRIQRRLHQRHHLQLRLRGLLRLRARVGRWCTARRFRHHQHHHARSRRRPPSSCVSARGCAVRKKAPRWERSGASWSAISPASMRPSVRGRSSPAFPAIAIEDLKFSNIYIETAGGGTADDAKAQPTEQEDNYPDPGRFGVIPATGFFLRHVRNVEMSHVEIANTIPDARPAFHLHDVDQADFFAVTAPRGADGVFSLNNVKDLRIGWSRAAADVSLASIDSKSL